MESTLLITPRAHSLHSFNFYSEFMCVFLSIADYGLFFFTGIHFRFVYLRAGFEALENW